MKFYLFFLLFGIVCQSHASTDEFVARVARVVDGNTFEIVGPEDEMEILVLAGIDCPDLGQPFAGLATRTLEKLILDKELKVLLQGRNRWGQGIAIVTIVSNGVDPRIEILSKGLAWTSEKDPVAALETIRRQAEQEGKGLWKDQAPTPPWIYRRQQSMMQPKSS